MQLDADLREVWKRLVIRYAPKAKHIPVLDHLERKYRHDCLWQDDYIANMMAADRIAYGSAMQGCKL